MKFKQFCDSLEVKIIAAYEQGVSLEDAEKLASEFLHGMLQVSSELKKADLNSRMRKSGNKAIRAAVYTDICAKSEKKPTESALDHLINMNDLVNKEQDALDTAEVERDELERYYDIFLNAHIHYRGTARGKFD